MEREDMVNKEIIENGFFKIEDIKSIKKNTEDMRPILMDIFDEELDRSPDFSLIYFI